MAREALPPTVRSTVQQPAVSRTAWIGRERKEPNIANLFVVLYGL